MKIQEVAIKPMFGMLQEQETQAKKNGERKRLKKKKPGEIVQLEPAKRKPLNMWNLLSTDSSTDELRVKSWPGPSTPATSLVMGVSTLALQIVFDCCKKFTCC